MSSSLNVAPSPKGMIHATWGVIALLAFAIVLAEPGKSEVLWEAEAIPEAIDLVSTGWAFRPDEAGARAILRLSSTANMPPDWRVQLDFGNGASLDVTECTLPLFVGGRSSSRLRVIQVVLPAAGKLTARVTPPDLKLFLVNVAVPQQVRSQQMIPGHERIDLFDAHVSPDDRVKRLSFGAVQAHDAYSSSLAPPCTAFRVANGVWLTALHCLLPHEGARSLHVDYVVIMPTDYADQSASTLQTNFRASVAGSGQQGGRFDPDAALMTGDLDYALLDAPDDHGGESFPLDSAALERSGQPVELFQHSLIPGFIGKARSAQDCAIKTSNAPGDPNQTDECSGQIQHSCSGEDGSSGGPLVTLAGQHLVGIHYGLGRTNTFNCALRVSSLRQHLKDNFCKINPTLAQRIVPCP